ncbi:MAG: hypothetical protein K8T89_06740 [Planctomycetes bacterium]|nr:hypothetical protein [Planctomycetota bacterium]
MFTVDPDELNAVREALARDRTEYGVGILHQPSSKIALRPFDQLRYRGGHQELISLKEWLPEDCLGFIVARPAEEYVMINLAQINTRDGPLNMPAGLFRNIVLSLRQCWAGMAACASPG